MVQCFSELQYKDSANEHHVIESMRNMVHSDNDLPVRLEAAIALQMLLKHQQSGINHTSLMIGRHWWRLGVVVSVVGRINELIQHRASYFMMGDH